MLFAKYNFFLIIKSSHTVVLLLLTEKPNFYLFTLQNSFAHNYLELLGDIIVNQ